MKLARLTTIRDEALASEKDLLPDSRMRSVRLHNAGRNVSIAPVRRGLFWLDLKRELVARLIL